ncbi:MAG TPA: uracil-DNA glycosylase [Candidatus Limnocylindria bacterium]|nr:uracil-DNA glycosylase [Candidatus Limnocylindria bacterium]
MNRDERKRVLDQIAAEVSVCTLCPLHVGRTNAVPGEGHPDTEVLFVGEGPGFNEDQQGRPFVGQAGGLLNELLKAIGWKREEVFITNVVKCRPPQNRDPEPSEIYACAPYLKRQLEALDPAVVVTLGRHSLQTFMPGARIGAVHGAVQPVNPQTGAGRARTYAMYHPAAALRASSLKRTMLEDMAGLPQVLIDARAMRDPATAAMESPQMPSIEPVLMPIEPEVAAERAMGRTFEPAIDRPIETSLVEADVDAARAVVAALPEPVADENQTTLFG